MSNLQWLWIGGGALLAIGWIQSAISKASEEIIEALESLGEKLENIETQSEQINNQIENHWDENKHKRHCK
jgi:hypothetical protein